MEICVPKDNPTFKTKISAYTPSDLDGMEVTLRVIDNYLFAHPKDSEQIIVLPKFEGAGSQKASEEVIHDDNYDDLHGTPEPHV